MNNEYITISEFAALSGVSKQAVYKQLNKRLKKFVKVKDGKKYIDKAALSKQVEQPFNRVKQPVEQPISQPVEQPFNEVEQPLRAFLEAQISEKDKQIENLFRQIEEKDKQIAELHTLLDQSQRLQMVSNNLLQERNQKKKGIFKLFGRKKEEVEQ